MKKLQLLKILMDLFMLSCIISAVGITIFVPIALFTKEAVDFPLKLNDQLITIDSLSSKIMLLMVVISYFIFCYGAWLFRKVLILFQKRIIFDDSVILLLHKIGVCFLSSTILATLSVFYFDIYNKPKVFVNFGGGFGSFLFMASVALFFMVLGEVFKISKTIKDENELTI